MCQAQRRLAERRKKLLDKQKQQLVETGVSEEQAEAAIQEIKAADEEADAHTADLETQLDQEEVALADAKRRELEAKLAAASTAEEKVRLHSIRNARIYYDVGKSQSCMLLHWQAALEASFNADMAAETARLEAERKAKRSQLQDRLAKRKAKVNSDACAKLDGADLEQVEAQRKEVRGNIIGHARNNM